MTAAAITVVASVAAVDLAAQRRNPPTPVGTGNPDARPSNSALDEAKAHFNVGMAALNDSNYIVALGEFEAAARLAPNNALVYYNLAIVQDRLRDTGDALANIQRAVALGLPPDVKAKADKLSASLTYEREKVNDDVAWLRQQSGKALLIVCGVRTTWVETRFDGSGGCDLALVEEQTPKSVGRDPGTPTSKWYEVVLRRVRSMSLNAHDAVSCTDGVVLWRAIGTTVTLSADFGQPEQQVTMWWPDGSLATRAHATLERAAQSCGAPFK
jgi:hypothetical protein